MLTEEMIRADAVLASLTPEQITAIETMSRNDEDVVIGKRFGDVYRQMDATIKEATGIDRDGDEKTYNYLKRAATEFAGKFGDYDALKQSVETLKGEKAALEAQIAKGGDAAIKSQLESATKELNATKEKFLSLQADFDKAKAENAKALSDYKIDSIIASAKDGVKFKAGLNEVALNTLIAQAIASVKAKSPSFEVRDGRERLIFHDGNGAPLTNAQNHLEPFTAKELLMKEFETLDILDNKLAKGAGGKESLRSGTDIVGAATQCEATDIINKMLAAQGLAKGSAAFQEKFSEIWKENNIDQLPLK